MKDFKLFHSLVKGLGKNNIYSLYIIMIEISGKKNNNHNSHRLSHIPDGSTLLRISRLKSHITLSPLFFIIFSFFFCLLFPYFFKQLTSIYCMMEQFYQGEEKALCHRGFCLLRTLNGTVVKELL